MTKDEILDDVATKMNVTREEAYRLMTMKSFDAIKAIPKTELNRIKSISSFKLIEATKSLLQSTIDSIKTPVRLNESDIKLFKEDIRYDAVNLFTPSVHKFLKADSEAEKIAISTSLYKTIDSKIDTIFSTIFKEVQE